MGEMFSLIVSLHRVLKGNHESQGDISNPPPQQGSLGQGESVVLATQSLFAMNRLYPNLNFTSNTLIVARVFDSQSLIPDVHNLPVGILEQDALTPYTCWLNDMYLNSL